jgi:ATP-dependent Clp protease ATP-binding subunit ClpC
MARIHRYQLCIIQDSEGIYTVKMLDDLTAVAVSNSRKEALLQMKEYLHYVAKDNMEPYVDFSNPRLSFLKVRIFAEYKEEKRTYALRHPILISMPCITGERNTGLHTAVLPTLDLSFDFHDPDTLTELGEHYIRSHFQGFSPKQISRYLPPESIEIEELTISLREPKVGSYHQARELDHLPKIADHIGEKGYLKQSRTWERDQVLSILEQQFREPKGGICLVGTSGCGKTSLIIETARRIELRQKKMAPGQAKEKLFWLTSGSRIIAGMQYLGQWQERLEKAIQDLADIGGVLCFESLRELLQLGGESSRSSIAAFRTMKYVS